MPLIKIFGRTQETPAFQNKRKQQQQQTTAIQIINYRIKYFNMINKLEKSKIKARLLE